MTFFLVASVLSYQKPVVLATPHRTWTSSQTVLISFHLCNSFCQLPRRGQQQLTPVLLTERGLTRRWRDKATKVMAAGHRRDIFHGWVWAPGKHSGGMGWSTEQERGRTQLQLSCLHFRNPLSQFKDIPSKWAAIKPFIFFILPCP